MTMQNMERKRALWVWFRSLMLPKGQEKLLLLRANDDIETLYEMLCAKDSCIDLLREDVKQRILAKLHQTDIEKANETLHRHQIDVVLREEADFPFRMQQVIPAPELLYLRGNRDLLRYENNLGIVGSRKYNDYGKQQTQKIALQLATAGICIVSGLAKGIDAEAHRTALKVYPKGRTIAILAGGLDKVYPPEHKELFAEIVQKGLIISENPPGYQARSFSVPQRNRLIAAMSKALFVPQAAFKSGTKYTIDAALDLGIDIYALPGRIDDPLSALPNYLLQQGARMVLEAQDILESFVEISEKDFAEISNIKEEKTIPDVSLTKEEEKIVAALQKEALSIDEMIMKTNLPMPLLLISLTKLEQKNMIHKEETSNRFSL